MYPWRIYLFCTSDTLVAMQNAAENIMPNGVVERAMFRLRSGAYVASFIATDTLKDKWVNAVDSINDTSKARYYICDNSYAETNYPMRLNNSPLLAESQYGAGLTFNQATTDFAAPIYNALVASPTGTSGGAGTTLSPMDLATALLKIAPGGLVELMAGIYTGDFNAHTSWDRDRWLRLQPASGATAAIDGCLSITSNVRVTGLEIYDSTAPRTNGVAGSTPPTGLKDCIVGNPADRVQLIDCVLHDGANGIYIRGMDWLIQNCDIAKVGWTGPSGEWYGNLIYIKIPVGSTEQIIEECNLHDANPTRYGIQAYSEDAVDTEDNLVLRNNTLTNANVIVACTDGSGQQVRNLEVTGNTFDGSDLHVGYDLTGRFNDGITVNTNTFLNASTYVHLQLVDCIRTDIQHNTFASNPATHYIMVDGAFEGVVDYNTYDLRRNPFAVFYRGIGMFYSTLAAWQVATGFDRNSQ